MRMGEQAFQAEKNAKTQGKEKQGTQMVASKP